MIFSPDGKFILFLAGDRILRIWNSNGKEPRIIAGHQDVVIDAIFNSDSSRLITVSRDQTAQIWDTENLESLATLRHEGSVLSAVYSGDESQILTTSADGTVRLWSASGSRLGSAQLGTTALGAAFDPERSGFLTLAGDEFRSWNKGGANTLAHQMTVSYAAFDPSSKRVLTLADRIARVWTLATNKFVEIGAAGSRSTYFVGDGRRIVLKRPGSAQLWSSEGTRLREFPYPAGIKSRDFLISMSEETRQRGTEFLSSSDGRFFLVRGRDSTALWDDVQKAGGPHRNNRAV